VFGFHPANLAFRFVLEIAALIAIGVGGYNLARGFAAWILAIGLPLIAAVAWGTFNVPGDGSRSGEAPVEVPGAVRLLLELVFFSTAVVLLWFVSPVAATLLGLGVLVHYLLSIDRIRWLIAAN
jgi:hypothetical protein